jgi:hypothetical protein
MKSIILILVSCIYVNAEIVKPQNIKIRPADIDGIHTIHNTISKTGDSGSRIALITKNLGGATDVSPRFVCYLTYSSYSEWTNVSLTFPVTTNALEILSISHSNTIVTIVTREYTTDVGFIITTYGVNYSNLNSLCIESSEEESMETCTNFNTYIVIDKSIKQ